MEKKKCKWLGLKWSLFTIIMKRFTIIMKRSILIKIYIIYIYIKTGKLQILNSTYMMKLLLKII